MKKIVFTTIVMLIATSYGISQECTVNTNATSTINICSSCNCTGGIDSLRMDLGNKVPRIIFTSVTIERGVSINLTGNGQIFEVPFGETVIINGDLIFSGSGSPKEFIVEGTLIINGTLDFENQQFEINGTGRIEADAIIGARNTGCVSAGPDASCPIITADTCESGTGDFCSTALPIELTSFTAKLAFDDIKLNWVTAKEENFSHFEVERTTDQVNYEAIGFVQGVGESLSDVTYDFIDNNAPFGVIYYRLKSVDQDGSFEYSWIISVKKSLEGKINVSPNPASSTENVKIILPREFKGDLSKVTLYDLNGTLIQESFDIDANEPLNINQNLKAGMYILKVQHNGLEENMRLIIR